MAQVGFERAFTCTMVSAETLPALGTNGEQFPVKQGRRIAASNRIRSLSLSIDCCWETESSHTWHCCPPWMVCKTKAPVGPPILVGTWMLRALSQHPLRRACRTPSMKKVKLSVKPGWRLDTSPNFSEKAFQALEFIRGCLALRPDRIRLKYSNINRYSRWLTLVGILLKQRFSISNCMAGIWIIFLLLLSFFLF